MKTAQLSWPRALPMAAALVVLASAASGSIEAQQPASPGRSAGGQARRAATPQLPAGPVREGIALLQAKRYQEAFDRLEPAARADPSNRKIADWAYLAGVNHLLELYKSKRYEDLLQIVDHVTLLKPDDFQSHFARGRALEALGRTDEAVTAYREARERSRQLYVTRALANAHLLLGDYPSAIQRFEEIVSSGKATAGDLSRLGKSHYESGDVEQAIAAIRKALEISPGEPSLQAALDRWSREHGVQADYGESGNVHFRVLFENTSEQREIKEKILYLLEQAYDVVTVDLGVYPEQLVQVIIYPSKSVYQDASDAPIWSAAVYNGKIRIPVAETKLDDEGLQRILQHEFTHLLVQQIGGNRVPVWMNEGIAQVMEKTEVPWARPLLRKVLGTRNLTVFFRDLKDLEGAFTGLPADQARIAYAQSYYAVRYILDMGGIWTFTRMLEELKAGEDPGDALKRATGYDYAKFQEKWTARLRADFHLGE